MLCSAPLCSVCFIDLQSSGVIRRRSSRRRRRWRRQRKEDEGAQGASTLLPMLCCLLLGDNGARDRWWWKLWREKLPNCVHYDVTATVDDTCASEHTLNTAELQRRPLKLLALQLSLLFRVRLLTVRLSVFPLCNGQSKRVGE